MKRKVEIDICIKNLITDYTFDMPTPMSRMTLKDSQTFFVKLFLYRV